MHQSHYKVLASLSFLVVVGWFTLSACGQPTAPTETGASSVDSQEQARRKILESDRWRRAHRSFNEWLSVQTIYGPSEVDAIRANFGERIPNMSPRELEDFLKDMEERLSVLKSPEAEDARQWLSQFMAVARNPEAQLGRARPDVLNMTASQIRQELQWVQQTRAERQQAHVAFNRGRDVQAQAARDVHATRQQAREQGPNRSAWPANNPRRPSQYAPTRQPRPAPVLPPPYSVSPWGHPIHWHGWRNW